MTDPTITSTANPRIKAVVRLRDRRTREREGLTIVDGSREVRRAIDAGVEVVEAYVCEPLLAGPDARAALDAIAAAGIPLRSVTEPVYERVAFGDRGDGIAVVVRVPPASLGDLDPPEDALLVVTERVEKPGNVGAILRTIDGAGGDGLIVAAPGTDLYNPNVIRASVGTVFRVPTATASTAEALAWLRERRMRMVAARVDAGTSYTDTDLTGSIAIVLGAEAEGLSGDWSGPDVEQVSIPMSGTGDSLNVSVSAAILLYEARRQRGPAPHSPTARARSPRR